ncbi:MAG: IS4 family transposase [Abyssibacter sp.]|nr:IS4 family transposase [Abyssibacter sp.]MCK5859577.1 IS4 family transposase [Abyssibacter sp.]
MQKRLNLAPFGTDHGLMLSERDGLMHRIGKTVVCPLLSSDQLASHSKRDKSLDDRRVVVVDGTGLSMPDTPENQSRWPQSHRQKPGCGFPTARMLGLFDLSTGGHIAHHLGNKHTSELAALRHLWSALEPSDILLGDRGFCSYFDIAQLQARQVDTVTTLKKRKPAKATEAIEVLGDDDLLIQWPKPRWAAHYRYSQADWETLPEYLPVRQIKVTVGEPGFRTQSFYLITTLTDPVAYSAESLADLYRQRWQVELYFRDIKTTLDMDVLRCQTPDMVIKEITMHWIVYNGLRTVMIRATKTRPKVSLNAISFKACIQAVRQWSAAADPNITPAAQRRVLRELLESIATATIPDRPGRTEPRCVKRRPKNYQRMTKPRDQMRVTPHRGKRAKKAA